MQVTSRLLEEALPPTKTTTYELEKSAVCTSRSLRAYCKQTYQAYEPWPTGASETVERKLDCC